MLEILLNLRPISKKNSKRWIIRGNRRFLVPSERFQRFEEEAILDIRDQHDGGTITSDVAVHTLFYIKGKYIIDGDNAHTSILDILEKARVIKNDKQVRYGSYEKINGCKDWKIDIIIKPYA